MSWSETGGRKKAGKFRAFAVGYNTDEPAPRLLAAGCGFTADVIVELAEKYGVPLQQDADLAEFLGALEPGAFIPPELYEAFAAILAGLYAANQGLKQVEESGNEKNQG